MKKVNIDFISEGFKEILCSEGVQSLISQETASISDRANANNIRGGNGFGSAVSMSNYGGGRWIGIVFTTDHKSRVAESEDKALSGAV